MSGRVLRRVVYAIVALPLVMALVVGSLLVMWLHGMRIPFAGATWFKVVKVGQATFSDEPTQPFFFLVVGNDGRTGDVQVRGDALHLVGVNPAAHSATVLNIPRDTGAEIPGHGTDKINAAMAEGGLSLEAQTVANLVGVKIPYAVTTNFDGFQALVDAVGGVDVTVQTEMHDADSGAFFSPGTYHMNGDKALRFNRDRHDFAQGDIQRTANQATFMIDALAQLRKNQPGAAGVIGYLAALGAHTQLQGIGLADLYRFGRLALATDPANVKTVTVPVTSGTGTRLALGDGAQSLFADFADDGVLQSH